MKKKVLQFSLFILFLSILAVEASGFDENIYNEQLEASGAEELFEALPEETVQLLSELGLKEGTFDGLFSADLRSVADLFVQIIRNEYKSPLAAFPVLALIVIVSAAFVGFVSDDSRLSIAVRIAVCSTVALTVTAELSACISRAVSALGATGNFMLCLIPVLGSIITVCGKPSLALTYNSLSIGVAQLTCAASESVLRPLVQIIMSLGIIACVTQMKYLSRLTELVKKFVVFLLSFSATVFITMLTLKGALSVSADNVAVRGIRFVIGNMIPVVGGAVSDAYTSIIGTLSLVKNTVGVFGIVAVALINIPVLLECAVWVLLLNVLGIVSDIFAQDEAASLFRSISSAVSLLAVILVFETLAFLLSVGLTVLIWSG